MRYYKPKDVQVIYCKRGYYCCVNPYSSNPISVVNAKAKEILEYCTGGKTVGQCYTKFKKTDRSCIKEILSELQSAELVFTAPKPDYKYRVSNVLGVWLHITNKCNLRCRYCYLEKSSEDMDYPTAKRVVDACYRSAEKHKKKTIKFKLSGGEAVLNFTLVKQIIRYARKIGDKKKIKYDFVVLSNGTCFTDSMLDWLKVHKARIMVSLDGVGRYNDRQRVFQDGTGTFKAVDRSIKRIQDKEVPFNVSVTLTNENVEGLPELIRYCLDRDIVFSINFYRENNCSQSDKKLALKERRFVNYIREAYKVIKCRLPNKCFLSVLGDRVDLSFPHNKTCAVGESYLVFDPNGRVSKCQMDICTVVSDASSEDPLGDVIRSNEGILNCNADKKPLCRKCVWRHYCCGGCPLLTYRATGNYSSKSPNCEIYKQLMPEIVRLEGLRLIKYGGKSTG